ncbi:neurotrypsin isoform X3 [Carcharodon carcharias]|uniref:neurotrypsin isoform X3 n=1 Tax=Carcharodon carcharias TaxID=13397 RepID=UPI001B7EFEF3|nr:neurotrypsin isoform X3 [Carcharodon carcharias]
MGFVLYSVGSHPFTELPHTLSLSLSLCRSGCAQSFTGDLTVSTRLLPRARSLLSKCGNPFRNHQKAVLEIASFLITEISVGVAAARESGLGCDFRMVLVSVLSTLLCYCFVDAEIAETHQAKDNHLSAVGWCLGSFTKLGYYTRSVTFTVTGEECLKWTEFPDYVQQYPNKGLGDHNFCRNPDGETIPWCFYRKKTGSISWSECDCNHGSVMPIRLVGGEEDYEGRVEVFHGGEWGTVCDDQWDDLDAEVVCRQLGLSGTAKSWMWSHFGHGSGPILLDEVECTGNELYLDECQKSNWRQHNCEHAEDAGVSCDPFADGVIRLVGGRDSSEGRLEIYRNGAWGTVCDDRWTDLNAQVVCRQLGFSGPGIVAPEAKFGQGLGFILLDEVVCTGTELELLGCARSNWGQHDCSHHEDVGVICAQAETNKISKSNLGPVIRLVDGENSKEGRVEVYLHGEWGSVCDDGWTDKDARVVCRQLGYSGQSKARTMAYFGEGHGPIHLDNVRCTGHENSLDECGTSSLGIHNCWHSEDAGVICDYKEDPLEELSSSGSLPSVCGLRLMNRRKKRIIGGNKSIRGGWPWQASLRLKMFYRESRLLCGATLINNCWVLTAAHCFKRFGNDTRHYFIRVGDYHTAVEDEYEREIPVEKIVTHKNYQPDSSDNDIALVRLKGKEGHCVTFNQYATPVCLPGRKEKVRINRQTCYITGWGDTGRSYSRTLLQGAVPLLPKKICESRYRNKFTARMICAGNLSEHKRVDSCQGDSGGPLTCQRTGGRWVILGITSWGYGCGRKDSPGVYTKVSKFVSWIKKVTETKVKMQENLVSKQAEKTSSGG